MSSSDAFGHKRTGAQPRPTKTDADPDTADQERTNGSTCPECDDKVVSDGRESYCIACGLVVDRTDFDHRPTRASHGPTNRGGPREWSCEPTNPLRVDKGLHTTFFLETDGHGNQLSSAQKDKYGRLRRRHKRFQMDDDRQIRLNEGLRDVESIGGNLALPRHVCEDAAHLLKQAAAARLPGGHMAWESLAAGAVLLAARNAGFTRDPGEVARFAKASLERVCAAARKIRCDLGVDIPPVRNRTVPDVLTALGDETLDVPTSLELYRLAEHLLAVADDVGIGPGTPRATVAGAAVYAADRLTDGKTVTQAEVAAAASTIVETSCSKIADYSRRLYDAYVQRYGQSDAAVVLERSATAVARGD